MPKKEQKKIDRKYRQITFKYYEKSTYIYGLMNRHKLGKININLSVLGKLKNSIFEISIIPQTLNLNITR